MSKSHPYPVQQPAQQQPPYPPQSGKSQHTTPIVFIIIMSNPGYPQQPTGHGIPPPGK